jgi:predicted DNA-binding transcriptional regulator YafY
MPKSKAEVKGGNWYEKLALMANKWRITFRKANNEITTRLVNIIGSNSSHLLKVFDYDRNEPRTYRMDRIMNMEEVADESEDQAGL